MPVVACHDCDLLNQIPDGAENTVLCARCGGVLRRRHRPDSLERSLALTFAALILFVAAVSFPFLTMKSGGFFQETTLLTGIRELWKQELYGLATLVLLTCVLVPLAQMACLLYLLVPLQRGAPAPHAIRVCRLVRHTAPWGMLEIFMLGILVALVKLGKMATIFPGISVFAFGLLVLVLAAAFTTLDMHLFVAAPGSPPMNNVPATARQLGLLTCHDCRLLVEPLPGDGHGCGSCPRCGAPLHERKPNSLARTWALIVRRGHPVHPGQRPADDRHLGPRHHPGRHHHERGDLLHPQRLLGDRRGDLHRQRLRAAAQAADPDHPAAQRAVPLALAARRTVPCFIA